MTLLKKLFILSFLLVTTLIAAPVMTWIPPYEVDACFSNLKANYGVDQGLSHLALQFWKPNGGQVTKDKYVIPDSKIREIRDYAQSKGIKVMLCVYNGDNGWNWSQAKAAFIDNRSSFVNSLVAKMESYNLDGIEIDLEGPKETTPYDGEQFIEFMRDLSTAVRAKGKELTVATFASEWHTPGTQHWSQLLPLVDGLTSMGYEEIGMSAGGDLSYARQKALASAAPEKLMLGMPDHVENWKGNSISQQVNWVKNDGVVGMALWDLQLRASGWRNSSVWNNIKAIKGTTGSDNGSGDNGSTGTATSNMVNWTQWTTSVDGFGTKVTSSSPIVSNGAASVNFAVVASNSSSNQYAWAYLESKLPGGAANNLSGVTAVEVTYKSNSDFSLKLAQAGIVEKGEAYMASLSNTNSQYTTKKIAVSSFAQPSWVSSTTPYNGAAVESILFQVDGGDNSKNASISVKELKLYGYKGDETGTVITYHTVTATAGSGGYVTPAGPQSVEDGENITFQIYANDGFEIEDVVVDGTSKGAKSSITIPAVSKDISVVASFKKSSGGPITNGKPLDINGALSISGRFLVNKRGYPIQLRGMSTHGIQYFQSLYEGTQADSICKALSENWGADVIRISNYVNEGSGYNYTSNPDYWHSYIDNLVDAAAKYGIYAIIDWHMLYPGDPNHYDYNQPGKGAEEFWRYMAKKHGGKDHVLFEICNEPNDKRDFYGNSLGYDVTWDVIKKYADRIIPIIRENEPDNKPNIIIVGTPKWAAEPDDAISNPLSDPNVMYTLHFYAATHPAPDYYYVDNLLTCIKKELPVFVTEFGTQDAAGEGTNNFVSSGHWLDTLDKYKISWVNWNLSNDWRSGAVYEQNRRLTSVADLSNQNNLKESGRWIMNRMKTPDDFGSVVEYPESGNLVKWASWEAKVDDYGSAIDTGVALVQNNSAKMNVSLLKNDMTSTPEKYMWASMFASFPKGDKNNLHLVEKIQVTYQSTVDARMSLPMPVDQSGEAYFVNLPASPTKQTVEFNLARFTQPSWAADANLDHALIKSEVLSIVFNVDGSDAAVNGFIQIDSLTLFNYQGEESGAEVKITEIHKKGLNKTFTEVDSVVQANNDTLVTTTTFNENADTLIHKKETIDNDVVIETKFDTVSITLDTVEVSKKTETLIYKPTVTTEISKDTIREIVDTTVFVDSVVQNNLDTVVTTVEMENYRDTIFTVTKTLHDGKVVKTDRVQEKIETGSREVSRKEKTLPYQPKVTTKEYEDTVRVIVDTSITIDSVVQENLDTVVTTVEIENYTDTIYVVTETYSDNELTDTKRLWNRVETKNREISREEKTLTYVEITTEETEEVVREVIDTTVSIDSVVQENLDTLVTTVKTENFRDTTFTIVKTFHNGDLFNTERTEKSVIEGSREISREEKTLPFESGVVVTTKEYEDTVREVIDTSIDVAREILENLDTVVTTVEFENFNDTVFNVIDTFHNDDLFDSERSLKEILSDSRVISEKKDTLKYIEITTETSEETVREIVDTIVDITKDIQDNLDTLVTTVKTEIFNDTVFTVVKTLHNGEVVETERTVKNILQGSREISREQVTVPYGAITNETTVEEEEIVDTTTTIDTVILDNGAADTLVTTTEIETFITHIIKVTDTILNSETIGTDRDTLSSEEDTRIISVTEDTLYTQVDIEEVDPAKKEGVMELAFAPNPVSRSSEGTYFRVPSDMDGEWTIQIFDALGNLIDESTVSSMGGAVYMWDLTNRSGQRITNGMYVAIISHRDRNGLRKSYKSFIGVHE